MQHDTSRLIRPMLQVVSPLPSQPATARCETSGLAARSRSRLPRAAVVLAATTVAMVVAIAAPAARADGVPCSTRHRTLHELFDAARDVAVVTVRAGQPPSRSGPAELVVEDQLKGAPAAVLHGREDGSCTAGLRTGRRALVFLAADGRVEGYWSGVITPPAPEIVDAMRAWAAATTAPERVLALVAAIESPLAKLADDAAYYLADEPALITAIDEASANRIAARTGGAQWGPEIILIRLHGPALAGLLDGGRLPRDLRAIARHRFEATSDPVVLALAIARAHRDPWRRVAAFERCERVHQRRLVRFSEYNHRELDAATWRLLASACRTGTPPTADELDAAAAAGRRARRR